MPWQLIVVLTTLIVAAVIDTSIAYYSFVHRNNQGAGEFALLMLAQAIYALGYAGELWSGKLPDILTWIRFEYLAIPFIPTLWLFFAARYTGQQHWLTRQRQILLLFISACTLVLCWTYPWHHLYYRAVSIEREGAFPTALLIKGPLYWVYIAYLHTAVIAGVAMISKTWSAAPAVQRNRYNAMLCGSGAAFLGNILYVARLSPWGIDLEPISFAITGICYVIGLFGYDLFTLLPVARATVLESMPEGVLVLDASGHLVDYNPAAKRIIPLLSPVLIGREASAVLADLPDLLAQIRVAKEQIDFAVVGNTGIRHYSSLLSPVYDRYRRQIGFTIILSDVTQRVTLVDRLWKSATTDGLTNILNRNRFLELTREGLAELAKHHLPASMIVFDLDNFKDVNDSYGHAAGDLVLQVITAACQAHLRSQDLFGRMGGEEFAVFLPGTSVEDAFHIGDRLRQLIAATPVVVDGTVISVTASFGIAGLPVSAGSELEGMLRVADQVLYRAKSAGKNRAVGAEM